VFMHAGISPFIVRLGKLLVVNTTSVIKNLDMDVFLNEGRFLEVFIMLLMLRNVKIITRCVSDNR